MLSAVKEGVSIVQNVKTAIENLQEFKKCMQGGGTAIEASNSLFAHTENLISILEKLNSKGHKEELEPSLNKVADEIQKIHQAINKKQGGSFLDKFNRFFSKDKNVQEVSELFINLNRQVTEILHTAIGAQGLSNDERIEHKLDDVGEKVGQATVESTGREKVAQAERQVILAETMYVGQQVEQVAVASETREQLAQAQRQEILIAVKQRQQSMEQRDSIVVMAGGAVANTVRYVEKDLRLGDRVYPSGTGREELENQGQAAAQQAALLQNLLGFTNALPANARDVVVMSKDAKAEAVEHIPVRARGGDAVITPAPQGKVSEIGLNAEQARKRRQSSKSSDEESAAVDDSLPSQPAKEREGHENRKKPSS
jgi:hypothetical protein